MKIPAVAKAVGYFHEDLIAGAMEDKIQRKPIRWQKWAALAACLAILLCIPFAHTVWEDAKVVHQGADYAIAQENGEFYLIMYKEGVRPNYGDVGVALTPPPDIYFASVADMKDFLLEGKFTNEHLLNISGFEKASNGLPAMLDLNAIWEPKLPEELRVGRVTWRGVNYAYLFGDGKHQGKISVLSETKYKEAKERYTKAPSENVVVETYTMDGFQITVQVEYGAKTDIFGEGNGIYYHAHLERFPKVANMEWLKEIGLQLYTDIAAE
jgi:hypothetical protein